jgi:hypothetical protein
MSATAPTTDPTPAPRRNRNIPDPPPVTTNLHGASAMTGLGISKLKELVAAGKIRSTVAGGRRLLFVNSIEDLLEAGVSED